MRKATPVLVGWGRSVGRSASRSVVVVVVADLLFFLGCGGYGRELCYIYSKLYKHMAYDIIVYN